MQEGAPAVVLYMVDAGGGHRSAAESLLAAAEAEGCPWRFQVVNLQEVLAPLDVLRRLTGLRIEEAYNALIQRQWTRLLVPVLRVLQWLIRRRRKPLGRLLARDLEGRRPALVVSLVPNFNAVIRDAVRQGAPSAAFWILLTDLADFPPRFWMVPGVDRVIVGSERAVEQARELGLPEEAIARTSGMVLHPRFYPAGGTEVRKRVRAELGIEPEAFAVLLLFGGKGSREMEPLARALINTSADWHVVAICGHNPRLFDRLGRLEAASGGRLHRIGFTRRVAEYLSACDLLATKPGPGSLAEAFHARVPVVVTCNTRTIPQERYNARFVVERGLGLVVGSWREIPAAVADLARHPQRLEACRRNLEGLPPNRAVYEVLEIVRSQLQARGALSTSEPADDRIGAGG